MSEEEILMIELKNSFYELVNQIEKNPETKPDYINKLKASFNFAEAQYKGRGLFSKNDFMNMFRFALANNMAKK